MGLGQRPRGRLALPGILENCFQQVPQGPGSTKLGWKETQKLEEWPRHSRQNSEEDLEPARKTD